MTQDEEDKWIRRIAIVKVAAFVLCVIILFVAFKNAEAATFGNTAADEGTSWNINNEPGGGVQNSTEGILQTFSTSASFRPASLTLFLHRSASVGGSVFVSLCVNPDRNFADPCNNGAASVLNDWSFDADALPTAAPPAPTILNFTSDTILYPGVSYGLWIRRDSGDGSVFVRYSTSDYAAGDAYDTAEANTCTPEWIYTAASSPSACSSTDERDARFHFTDVAGGLTATATVIGGSVQVSGLCFEPGDLPDGWTLESNLVSVKYQDIASNGTWVLDSPECTGGYTTTRNLWNADYIAVVTQAGSPHTFTASATFTIDISDNPVQDPVSLAFFGCENLGYEEESLQCRIFNAVRPVTFLAPYSWLVDVKVAVDNATATQLAAVITVPSQYGAGSQRTLDLFSSASSGGLVNEIKALPQIGGKTMRQLMEIVLWIGVFGAYVTLRIYSLAGGGGSGGDL